MTLDPLQLNSVICSCGEVPFSPISLSIARVLFKKAIKICFFMPSVKVCRLYVRLAFICKSAKGVQAYAQRLTETNDLLGVKCSSLHLHETGSIGNVKASPSTSFIWGRGDFA